MKVLDKDIMLHGRPMRHRWVYVQDWDTTICQRCGDHKTKTTLARSCRLKAVTQRG